VSLNLLEEGIKTAKLISLCMSAEDYNPAPAEPLSCRVYNLCVFSSDPEYLDWLLLRYIRSPKVGRTSERGRSLHTQRLSPLALASVNRHQFIFQNKSS